MGCARDGSTADCTAALFTSGNRIRGSKRAANVKISLAQPCGTASRRPAKVA